MRQIEPAPDAAAAASIKKLTLQDLVNEAYRIISLRKDKSAVAEPVNTEILAVHHSNKKKENSKRRISGKSNSTLNSDHNKPSKPPNPCRFYGEEHWERDCHYQTKKCADCKRIGHKTGYCVTTLDAFMARATRKQRIKQRHQRRNSDPGQVHQIRGAEAIDISQRKFIAPTINGAKVKLQLDWASDITLILQANWKKLGKSTLERWGMQPGSASGDPVPLFGAFQCHIKFNEKEEVSARNDLLGIDWIIKLGLWNIPFAAICNSVMTDSKHVDSPQACRNFSSEARTKFSLLFSDGLGCCNKIKVSLTFKQDAKPIF